MLTTDQLLALLADHESDAVEFTTSTKNTDKFCEAICAFANDFPNHQQPGYLLVGINDDRTASGLTVTDQLLRRLSDLRSNVNLEPLAAISVHKHTLPDGEIAVVEVLPSDLPPVRYKGRVWIRIGPSRRGANQQEERILVEKRAALQKPFDIRPCHGCTLDDLALDLFSVSYLPAAVDREVIAEHQRDVPEQMASLRLYDLASDCPTNAAALLFAKDPLRWIAGAYVQFVRWAGTTMADDPISAKSFSGDLLTILREVASFVEIRTESFPVAETPFRERPEIDYPPVAVREILMNAIMHRSYESNAPVHFYWYEDRIDIQSPGGLYGMASPENFPRQTDYRNPVIAEAMATLGYVNHFGRGVIRAQEALRRNGNTEASFTFDPSHVLATMARKP
ncbi:MAG: putative DNA binding domain-containing protein [Spirochaetaceae bacterium]|nr:putative DNA binding domain-containing protein [Spirochaetaceae bacterium]